MTKESSEIKKELITKEQFAEQLAEHGINDAQFKVIREILYPNVQKVETLLMALAYCKHRKLDIMKKPIQIVPIYNSKTKKMEDTIWASITEIRTTATRTGNYAGRSEAEFGNSITREFVGKIQDYDTKQWSDVKKTVTYPEWCKISVFRMVGGQKCEFISKLFWLESYKSSSSKSEVPNDMWGKRPYAQLEKCTEAAALRCAFPEEIGNDYIAEEAFSKEDLVDSTPAVKPTVDVLKLPDTKPVFASEPVIEGKEFDLYSKIRLELINAENDEQVEKVAEFYKSQFSALTKEQQKDLSVVKKGRLELFAMPDVGDENAN